VGQEILPPTAAVSTCCARLPNRPHKMFLIARWYLTCYKLKHRNGWYTSISIGMGDVMSEQRYVEIPGSKTHELPPLLLHCATDCATDLVAVMPEAEEMLAERLQKMGVEVLRATDAPDNDTLANLLKGWLAAGPVHGVYWLPALDNEGDLITMNLASWHEALRVRVKSLYATMRILFEQIAAPGTFLDRK